MTPKPSYRLYLLFQRGRRELTMEQFHAYLRTMAEAEKCELIDGMPMKMPPRTCLTDRSNLESAQAHSATSRLDRRADHEEIVVALARKYIRPDVTVTSISRHRALATCVYGEHFLPFAAVVPGFVNASVDSQLDCYKEHDTILRTVHSPGPDVDLQTGRTMAAGVATLDAVSPSSSHSKPRPSRRSLQTHPARSIRLALMPARRFA